MCNFEHYADPHTEVTGDGLILEFRKNTLQVDRALLFENGAVYAEWLDGSGKNVGQMWPPRIAPAVRQVEQPKWRNKTTDE